MTDWMLWRARPVKVWTHGETHTRVTLHDNTSRDVPNAQLTSLVDGAPFVLARDVPTATGVLEAGTIVHLEQMNPGKCQFKAPGLSGVLLEHNDVRAVVEPEAGEVAIMLASTEEGLAPGDAVRVLEVAGPPTRTTLTRARVVPLDNTRNPDEIDSWYPIESMRAATEEESLEFYQRERSRAKRNWSNVRKGTMAKAKGTEQLTKLRREFKEKTEALERAKQTRKVETERSNAQLKADVAAAKAKHETRLAKLAGNVREARDSLLATDRQLEMAEKGAKKTAEKTLKPSRARYFELAEFLSAAHTKAVDRYHPEYRS